MAYLEKGQRARNVECIIYPEDVEVGSYVLADGTEYQETARGNIVSYLDSLRVQCALSPVHDADEYDVADVKKWIRRHTREDLEGAMTLEEAKEAAPKVGELKKAHYHVLFKFAGNKTGKQLSDMMAGLVSVPEWRWEVIERLDSSIRYLAHLDSVDQNGKRVKPLYNSQDIIGFGGIDLSCLLRTDEMTKLEVTADVKQAIRENGIRYYNQLLDWAESTGCYEYMASVQGRVSLWCQYLGGRSLEAASKAKKDLPNGEQS